ncbi:hypothetical protein EI16_12015 [Hydrogenovibrio marinus]|uniref:PilZ domain-containing protein n=2 Tax=Hydrogenovibrio marinus TaxID=28885 RepID=A0A066ZLE0_HYDMR|nr:hypothetical protein EI16_12015 [Hydrogenovibrio marinus]
MGVFVIPSARIAYMEIYSTGAEYYTPGIKSQAEFLKHQVNRTLGKISDNKELVSTLVDEFIVRVVFLEDCLSQIINGYDPSKDPAYTIKVNSYKLGIAKIEQLKSSSPKSYQYFKALEEFLMFFIGGIIRTVDKSDVDTFFPIDSQRKFSAEKFAIALASDQHEKIPFLQLIRHVSELIQIHANVFRQLSFDCSERSNPQNWDIPVVNVSEGGIALPLNKRFKETETVDVAMHLKLTNAIIYMTGYVVNLSLIEGDPLKERVAINFEFPDGKMQAALRKEIQAHEISALTERMRDKGCSPASNQERIALNGISAISQHMLGSNYHLDNTFIDELSIKNRDVAKSLLSHIMLAGLLDIKDSGITPEFSKEFSINEISDLTEIINSCILTKITYFDISVLSPRCLVVLIYMACDALRLPKKQPIELHELTKAKHHVFSKWMLEAHKQLLKLRNQKVPA